MPDIYTVPFTAVATVAATAKTVVQVLAGTRRILLAGYRVGAASGTSTDAPATFQLILQTTAGTMSAGSIRLSKKPVNLAKRRAQVPYATQCRWRSVSCCGC
jgi:hypothetical protein